jgi:hypothetical protein
MATLEAFGFQKISGDTVLAQAAKVSRMASTFTVSGFKQALLLALKSSKVLMKSAKKAMLLLNFKITLRERPSTGRAWAIRSRIDLWHRIAPENVSDT